jgi:hypothetical protein
MCIDETKKSLYDLDDKDINDAISTTKMYHSFYNVAEFRSRLLLLTMYMEMKEHSAIISDVRCSAELITSLLCDPLMVDVVGRSYQNIVDKPIMELYIAYVTEVSKTDPSKFRLHPNTASMFTKEINEAITKAQVGEMRAAIAKAAKEKEEPVPTPEVKEEPVPAPTPEEKEEPVPAPEVKEEPVPAPTPEVKEEPVPAPTPEVKEEPVPAPTPEEKEEPVPAPVPAPEEKEEPVPAPEEKEEPVPAPEEKEEPVATEPVQPVIAALNKLLDERAAAAARCAEIDALIERIVTMLA